MLNKRTLPLSKYCGSPTIVRLVRAVEGMAMQSLGIDPLLMRTVALDMQLRFAARL